MFLAGLPSGLSAGDLSLLVGCWHLQGCPPTTAGVKAFTISFLGSDLGEQVAAVAWISLTKGHRVSYWRGGDLGDRLTGAQVMRFLSEP